MSQNHQFEIEFCQSILKWEPDCIPVLEMLAGFFTQSGRIDEGLALDRKIVLLDPDNAINHYNLACSFALKHMADDALGALRTALEQGYDDFEWLMNDADLASLHKNPALSALLSEFQAQQP